VVSEAAELAPERAADCESVAVVEGTNGEVLYIYIGQPAYYSGIKSARRSMCEKLLRHVDRRKAQRESRELRAHSRRGDHPNHCIQTPP
jgi:hypothetical protein